jgi:predicted amidophosphoribosyltransferase
VYPPISLKDRIFRWPNHAKRLAKIFAKVLGWWQVCCPFRKNVFAWHQSRRNKTQRKQIVQEYTLKQSETSSLYDKDIVFIDDIITTGYTMLALWNLLSSVKKRSMIGFFLASHKV